MERTEDRNEDEDLDKLDDDTNSGVASTGVISEKTGLSDSIGILRQARPQVYGVKMSYSRSGIVCCSAVNDKNDRSPSPPPPLSAVQQYGRRMITRKRNTKTRRTDLTKRDVCRNGCGGSSKNGESVAEKFKASLTKASFSTESGVKLTDFSL